MYTHRKKCPKCHGSGRSSSRIVDNQKVEECNNCDSTGMFLVKHDNTEEPDYGWMPGFGSCIAAEQDIPIL